MTYQQVLRRQCTARGRKSTRINCADFKSCISAFKPTWKPNTPWTCPSCQSIWLGDDYTSGRWINFKGVKG